MKKKSRLIIRNVSFQVTDEKLRQYFSPYGNITEINILKKPNGKLVGCAFVQFETVAQAAKAIRELNAKQFLGRPIAIDWSLPKEKFQGAGQKNDENNPETNENEANEEVKIKVEPPDDDDQEKYDYVEDALQSKIEGETDDDEPTQNEQKKKRHSADSDSEDSQVHRKRQKINPNDADEGKTVFIRNLEFETTPDELKAYFSNYGPLNYAVICKDRLTEHPKGTAFVMFWDAEDANKCLTDFENEPSKFILGRRQFVVSLALSKSKLESKLQNAKKEPKDTRNLYLAREGFIRPESNAAIGVSVADMDKRVAIQRVKKQMLKNLHIFISDTRLCVHNLPPSLSDKALRKIFLKHGGPGATVIEARVMRDLKNRDLSGVGKSKEYGFVTFTKHEHALNALRAVNNNPEVFTPSRRPIVEFSLENRAAINVKEKRAEKSREKNLQKQANNSESSNGERKPKTKKKAKPKVTPNRNSELSNNGTDNQDELPVYSGLTAKHGIASLPSLKPKGKVSRNSLKLSKSKSKKQQARKKREPLIKPKIKIRKDEKATEKLISRHKRKLKENEKAILKKTKSKWYQ